jgi:hypothetical protein
MIVIFLNTEILLGAAIVITRPGRQEPNCPTELTHTHRRETRLWRQRRLTQTQS